MLRSVTDQEKIAAFLLHYKLEAHADKFVSWEDLMTKKSRAMKTAGIPVKDRKRILTRVEDWKQMQHYLEIIARNNLTRAQGQASAGGAPQSATQ